MAEGFHFMPLGLVRLRTFCLSALVIWCNINTGVHARTDGADVSLRDVTIAQMGNGASKCEWRHAPEVRGGFWEFWRKLGELKTRHRTRRVDFRLLAEALGRCRTRWGGRWKNVYLSSNVKEPLNSKVIKSFVPEWRSRKCFSCFEMPIFYVIYIWTLYVHFKHSHIWLWYIYYILFIYIFIKWKKDIYIYIYIYIYIFNSDQPILIEKR